MYTFYARNSVFRTVALPSCTRVYISDPTTTSKSDPSCKVWFFLTDHSFRLYRSIETPNVSFSDKVRYIFSATGVDHNTYTGLNFDYPEHPPAWPAKAMLVKNWDILKLMAELLLKNDKQADDAVSQLAALIKT